MTKREILFELDKALNAIDPFFFAAILGCDTDADEEEHKTYKHRFIVEASPTTHIRFLFHLLEGQISICKNFKINRDKCLLERSILQGLMQKTDSMEKLVAVKKLPIVNDKWRELSMKQTENLTGNIEIQDTNGNPVHKDEIVEHIKNNGTGEVSMGFQKS